MRMILDILKALGDASKAILAMLQLSEFLSKSIQKKKPASDVEDRKRTKLL